MKNLIRVCAIAVALSVTLPSLAADYATHRVTEWKKARVLATTQAIAQTGNTGARSERLRNRSDYRFGLFAVPNIPAEEEGDTQQSDVPWWLNSDEWAANGQDDPAESDFGDEDRAPMGCDHDDHDDHDDDDSSSVDLSPCE